MGKFTYSVEINRPPAEVFAYLDDSENAKKWLDGLVEITPLTEGGNRVGAKARHLYNEGGRNIEMIEETLAYEPNRRVKFKGVTDGFWLTVDYTLHPIQGGTRIDFEEELHPTSLMMRLLSPLITFSSKKKLREDFERLKALIEA